LLYIPSLKINWGAFYWIKKKNWKTKITKSIKIYKKNKRL